MREVDKHFHNDIYCESYGENPIHFHDEIIQVLAKILNILRMAMIMKITEKVLNILYVTMTIILKMLIFLTMTKNVKLRQKCKKIDTDIHYGNQRESALNIFAMTTMTL